MSWAKQIGTTVLNHYRGSLERVTAKLREFDEKLSGGTPNRLEMEPQKCWCKTAGIYCH